MGQLVKELNDAEFGVATASGVTLVDFWAPWCGPCRMQAPILEEVAAALGGRATVAKINVDESSRVAARFEVQSIPTLIVFRDGQPVRRFVGLQRQETLVAALEGALGAKV